METALEAEEHKIMQNMLQPISMVSKNRIIWEQLWLMNNME